MNRIFLVCVLTGGLAGCSAMSPHPVWPVAYDCEKGPTQLSISRQPETLDCYTHGIPDWNYALRVPAAKISSAGVEELGELDGLRVLEVRIVLTDRYYTGGVMILEEVDPGRFLPVYVQDYNRNVRSPAATTVVREPHQLIAHAGMDYDGTGHFHSGYRIVIALNRDPVVVGSYH